jgi:hypothetical protein
VIEGRASRIVDRQLPALPSALAVTMIPDVPAVRPLVPPRREHESLVSSIAFAEDTDDGYTKGGTNPAAVAPPPVPTFDAPRSDATCDYHTADPVDLVSLQSSEEQLH